MVAKHAASRWRHQTLSVEMYLPNYAIAKKRKVALFSAHRKRYSGYFVEECGSEACRFTPVSSNTECGSVPVWVGDLPVHVLLS